MSDAVTRSFSAAPIAPEHNRPRWTRALLGGLVVVVAAAGFGYVVGRGALGRTAEDPLEVIASLQPSGLTCTQIVEMDDDGEQQTAVCLSIGNEVLTIGTFAAPPDPEAWAAELCASNADGVVPARGALVVVDTTLVAVAAGPLFAESGGRVPHPDAVAEQVAGSLNGRWQPYTC